MHKGDNMSAVQIHSEFQPLEEIILGDCYEPGTVKHGFKGDAAKHFERILAETKEDLDSIADLLRSHGITVRRPRVVPYPRETLSIYGRFNLQWPSAPLVSRDFNMCLGDTVIQTYGSLDNRYFEDWGYRDIFADYLRSGSGWISMPKPDLRWSQGPAWRRIPEDSIDAHAAEWLCRHFQRWPYQPEMWGELMDETNGDVPWELMYGVCLRDRPLYHAAAFIKCGDTLLYNHCGSELGESWMRREITKLGYKLHRYRGWGHIDGTVMLVRPGLYIGLDRMDGPLADWDFIDVRPLWERERIHKMREARLTDLDEFVSKWFTDWQGYSQEAVFDINGISIDERTIMLCSKNPEIDEMLGRHGIEVVHAPIRHRYFWDNGLHCMTCDVRRRGPMESYFD